MKRNGKWWMIGGIVLIAAISVYAAREIRGVPDPRETAGLQGTVRPQAQNAPPASPGTGRVTMIDLGATECIPCKMMAPIIEELKTRYAGKADIVFIDVWKYPDQAEKFGVKVIPTQIFYDANGKEVFRNIGFLDKNRIVDILTKLGVS
jgi:thioredoxin 1